MPKLNKTEYDQNYDQIDWTKKIPKTFKTSWGVEYTVMVKKEVEKKEQSGYTTEELQNIKKRPSSIT